MDEDDVNFPRITWRGIAASKDDVNTKNTKGTKVTKRLIWVRMFLRECNQDQ